MEKNKLLKDKSIGFYVTLVLSVLSVVMAAVYAIMYQGSLYMSWKCFGVVVGGAVITLALAFTKQAKWAYAVLALADFAGLLFYVYGIYFYVSVVLVGIQASNFSSQFIFCTAGFAALLVLNVINVFLKQVKEVEE